MDTFRELYFQQQSRNVSLHRLPILYVYFLSNNNESFMNPKFDNLCFTNGFRFEADTPQGHSRLKEIKTKFQIPETRPTQG